MYYKRNRDKIIFLVIFLLVLFIGIGYAYLSSVLNITGNTQIAKNTWDIHFENISVIQNVNDSLEPSLTNDDSIITFTPKLKKPKEYYQFTVNIKNAGTIDAMVSEVVKSGISTSQEKYTEFTVTYLDGQQIQQKDKLGAGKSLPLKVTVKYKDDITAADLPQEDQLLTLSLKITYIQDDGTGKFVVITKSFAEDSWQTIIDAIKNGRSDIYKIGDTKEVDMGSFGTHTIRVANTSTPSECSTAGFSQTACGFVIEFSDIITKYKMNSTDTSRGGWPASQLYTYLQNDIYNALPSELKSGIIDTYVVSSHGSEDSANFTSTDKLFLLSPKEVLASSGDTYDTSEIATRQLEYYESKGVTLENKSEAVKKYNNLTYGWWLRSTLSYGNYSFYGITFSGDRNYNKATTLIGVSPAFRIG